MDLNAFIIANAASIADHQAEVEKKRLADEKHAAEERAKTRKANIALWLALGAADADISDEGEVTIGDWIVKAQREESYSVTAEAYRYHIGISISPSDQTSREWLATIEIASECDGLRVGESRYWRWMVYQPAPSIGEIAAYIAETLPKMPEIWSEQVAAAQAERARIEALSTPAPQPYDEPQAEIVSTLLYETRRAVNLTIKGVADMSGITVAQLLDFESGTTLPNPTQWADLRAALPTLPVKTPEYAEVECIVITPNDVRIFDSVIHGDDYVIEYIHSRLTDAAQRETLISWTCGNGSPVEWCKKHGIPTFGAQIKNW